MIAAWMQQLYDLLASVHQLSPWAYLLVLAGGVASALSPCYVPVLAMFAGYVGGYARPTRSAGVRLALPFVLANAVVLAAVGAVAALAGNSVLRLFTGYQLDRWVPGLIGLVMGLQLLGVLDLHLPTPPTFKRAPRPGTAWGAFLLGLPFGLVVTPCTIPIFFAVVGFVAFQASVLHGALLMVAYALGRGTILLAVAVSAGLLKALRAVRSTHFVEQVGGILLAVVSLGLLVYYDDFVRFVGQWGLMAQ